MNGSGNKLPYFLSSQGACCLWLPAAPDGGIACPLERQGGWSFRNCSLIFFFFVLKTTLLPNFIGFHLKKSGSWSAALHSKNLTIWCSDVLLISREEQVGGRWLSGDEAGKTSQGLWSGWVRPNSEGWAHVMSQTSTPSLFPPPAPCPDQTCLEIYRARILDLGRVFVIITRFSSSKQGGGPSGLWTPVPAKWSHSVGQYLKQVEHLAYLLDMICLVCPCVGGNWRRMATCLHIP